MSLGLCSACKNECSCTYPRNKTITQCEEYQHPDSRSRPPVPAGIASARSTKLWNIAPRREHEGALAARS